MTKRKEDLEDDCPALDECLCGCEVYPGDPFFGTPCGSFCPGCMERHAEDCPACGGRLR